MDSLSPRLICDLFTTFTLSGKFDGLNRCTRLSNPWDNASQLWPSRVLCVTYGLPYCGLRDLVDNSLNGFTGILELRFLPVLGNGP